MMAGMVILSAMSLMGIGFMGVFFVALCRERRHFKICMLLRQDSNDGDGVQRFTTSGHGSEQEISAIAGVLPMRKTLMFRRDSRKARNARVA
jgi:hypothetical protein